MKVTSGIHKLPIPIQLLLQYVYSKTPVPGQVIDVVRAKYPSYWNELGEFDPFFERRNKIINFCRHYVLRISRRIHTKWVMWKVGRSSRRLKRAGFKGYLSMLNNPDEAKAYWKEVNRKRL